MSTLPVGAHTLVAVYGPSDSFAASQSSALAFAVDQAQTATTLASSRSTAALGQLVTFTATVAPTIRGSANPTGTVEFLDGSTVIGTVPLSGGVASLTVALTGAGTTHVIEATYAGNEGYGSSNSAGSTVTVVRATPTARLIAAPVFVGRRARGVTFTIFVQAGTTAGPVPTGSVAFQVNRTTLKLKPLVNGSASIFVATTKATGRTFLVRYRGDTNFKPATSSSIHITSKFFKPKPAVTKAPG